MILAARGLAASRAQAQRLIAAGQVCVAGQVVDKAGHAFVPDSVITVREGERFVGRGGWKLEKALAVFHCDVQGMVGLDVGASTGGFTDCLLQHGAAKVHAVDVGKGQLHWKLRQDHRVVVHEGVNARYLTATMFPERIDLAVIDVAFISLTLILPPVTDVLGTGGHIISLIKPQFEAGRAQVERGGVVRDVDVRQAVVAKIRRFGEEQLGLIWRDSCSSPLRGPAGNEEFLAYWEKP